MYINYFTYVYKLFYICIFDYFGSSIKLPVYKAGYHEDTRGERRHFHFVDLLKMGVPEMFKQKIRCLLSPRVPSFYPAYFM